MDMTIASAPVMADDRRSASRRRTAPSGKFEGLRVLRFLAASAVVAFHAYGAGINYLGPYPALSLLHHGDYGVDLFFVLASLLCVSFVGRAGPAQPPARSLSAGGVSVGNARPAAGWAGSAVR